MKIPELLRSLVGGILPRHRRTRLTFTASAVDLTTYEYAAAIYSAMMDLILSAVKKTEWRLVSGGSFKWGALSVFLRCHADEIVAGMINDGTVSVRRDGDVWRFCEEQEEADYVFQSADWRIRNLSTYQILQPALAYLNNIVNAANTSISRLGVLACFSPKQDEYGNTLTPEELEAEEKRLQTEYGALHSQKVVKFFQHSYDLNVINIAGENLQLSDRFTQAIKMLCSKLKIPFELVPCAVLGNNNQTGVYQGEAVKRLYQTVAEWQSYIIDFCAAVGFKVEAINNDAPKDYEAEAEAVRSAALANLRAATEAGYMTEEEARAEYRSLIGL